jgi:hypothetical protein
MEPSISTDLEGSFLNVFMRPHCACVASKIFCGTEYYGSGWRKVDAQYVETLVAADTTPFRCSKVDKPVWQALLKLAK